VFIVLGVNHQTASVDVRERVAFESQSMAKAMRDARKLSGCRGVAILSTCNRTELYFDFNEKAFLGEKSKDDQSGFSLLSEAVVNWLADWHGLPQNELSEVHYIHVGQTAISHLMKVASGLDSLVLGEPQILGQLKSAYSVALNAGSLSSDLHRSFQKVFSVAKRIRTETTIGKNPVSVAYAAVSLARQIFAELHSKTALLIGAGETIRLVSQHLAQQNVTRLIIANRTLDNAETLAAHIRAESSEQIQVEAVLLVDIPENLHRADIVISSTASQLPILGKGAVESALKKRKRALMFMVDIAVPRDIEHEVDELDDVYLFSVDDLSEVIEENRRSREEAANQALSIIDESVDEWVKASRVVYQADMIKLYREQAVDIKEVELQRALASISAGDDMVEVVKRLANTLTNKLIHRPTIELNKAISEGQNTLIDAAQTILGIDDFSASESGKVREKNKRTDDR